MIPAGRFTAERFAALEQRRLNYFPPPAPTRADYATVSCAADLTEMAARPAMDASGRFFHWPSRINVTIAGIFPLPGRDLLAVQHTDTRTGWVLAVEHLYLQHQDTTWRVCGM